MAVEIDGVEKQNRKPQQQIGEQQNSATTGITTAATKSNVVQILNTNVCVIKIHLIIYHIDFMSSRKKIDLSNCKVNPKKWVSLFITQDLNLSYKNNQMFDKQVALK